ncbi:MAG: hypothetical protein WCD76_00585, partial [Pyrinomonadaceae bacterium]
SLESAVEGLLNLLDVKYCVSHWEFIVTPQERIALVEGHLRPAGDRIMELVEHSTGRSPTAVLCEALARREADFRFEPRGSCGIFWLIPQSVLEEVREVKVEGEAAEGLCEDLYVNVEGIKATANWKEASDWMTRFAHVMAKGRDLEEVKEKCREVARSVKLSGTAGGREATTRLKLAVDS